MATEADRILREVLGQLGLTPDEPEQAYRQIATIVELLEAKNREQTIAVSTTGTITERLCELGLKAIDPNCYRKLQKELNYLELQTDIHRARETRKKWNAVEKEMRRHPKRVF